MDHIKVVRRAFEITWRYKALWIFGIILALTTAGGSPGSSGGGGGGGGGNGGHIGGGMPGIDMPLGFTNTLIGIGVAVGCLALLFIVVSAIARWVAEVSLVRMVDDYEETGERLGVRDGFRAGWSRSAWRLFLIDLVITLPTAVIFIVLLALVASPALLWLTDNTTLGVIGTIAAVGLFFLWVLFVIVVSVVLSTLSYFFRRACVLEGKGVGDSIRYGYDLVKRHWLDVGLMWLLMVGLKIAWALVTLFITLLLFILAGILGGIPGILVGLAANAIIGEAAGWVSGGVVAGVIFLVVMALPSLFLGGLSETYKSTLWTLTYRELRVLNGVAPDAPEPEPLPVPDELDPDSL